MKRALMVLGALLIVDLAGARALDALGVMESLLSPGPRALVALPLVALFFAARLLLLFVAPGLCAAALLSCIARRRRFRTPGAGETV